MENASKALIIAGGMLIAIILFTLMSYAFSIMGQNSSEFYNELNESDVTEFNQKFLNFEGKDLNVQDVVTIINLAKDNNRYEKVPTEVDVLVDGVNYCLGNQDLNVFISNNMEKKYVIKNIDILNKLVKKVEIEQKN